MIEAARRVWSEIKQGENIDLYLTVAVALFLALLSMFGIGESMLDSITLAVLALLAISSLVNRRKSEETLERLSREQDVLLESFPGNKREEHIRGAKEVWLIGLILNKTINENYPLFLKKLSQGDRIRVLIVDPNSPYGELIAQRKLSPDSLDDIRNYQNLTLSKLCSLKNASPKNIEIRTTQFPPFFGAVAIDMDSIEGIIYVEQYSYKTDTDLPKLVFERSDTKWFDIYRQQIMQIWNDSHEWMCA